MSVVCVGHRVFRGEPLSACDYESHTAAALGWTGSGCSVLVSGSRNKVLVSRHGIEQDTVATASDHREADTLLSQTIDCYFHRVPLRGADMGQKRSDTTEPEIHNSSWSTTASDFRKGSWGPTGQGRLDTARPL